MNEKLISQILTCILIMITLVILPLLLKIKYLKKHIKKLDVSMQRMSEMKTWENELYNIIKGMIGNLGFNENIYIGAYLAYQRGFQMDGLEQWLSRPLKDKTYNKLINLLIDTFPNHKELYGFNELDNIARVLCASAYKTKKFHNIICDHLDKQDIRTVFETIDKQNKLLDLVIVFNYLNNKAVTYKNDNYYQCQKCIEEVIEDYSITNLLVQQDDELLDLDIYAEYENANQVLVDIIVDLIEQNKISINI